MPALAAELPSLDETIPPLAQMAVVFGLALLWGIWLKLRQSRTKAAGGVSPLNSPGLATKSGAVIPVPPRPLRRIVTGLLLQTLIWCALTVAFAALLRLAGPQSWPNALRFAGLNWMPWVVLAPLVFWFSGQFPLERGHLWRSIPAHILGCAGCVAFTVWVAAYIGYGSRPPGRFEDRRERPPPGEFDRGTPPTPAATSAPGQVDQPAPPTPPAFERNNRPEPFSRGERPFGRRGPGWWPFLGATLLRANFDAAVYLIVVFAAHSLSFYRRAQEREQHAVMLTAGLHRAKLDALRLQLQPHFLFNTLNAISTLVHRDAAAADNLIGDLSDLLRLSLQTTDHEVPLVREVELLDRYIAIEQARLGARLRVVREIDPATERALVPTFLLQPLVENAIRHGIEPRLAPGTVTIRASRVQDQLVLSVFDDGVGLAASATRGNARRGIGITNTEERLRALHGDAGRLVITTPPSGGVQVQVTLPFSTVARNGRSDSNAAGNRSAGDLPA